MPRGKRPKVDLLSLLAPERRQEIFEEALGARVRGLFERQSRATLGKLVEALTNDELWEQIQHVRVETVLSPRAGGTGGKPRRGRPPGSRSKLSNGAIDQIVEVIRRKPNLRSEQIQRELTLAPGVVKSGLAKLRLERRVKTTGQRRSTTYALA
jgi:hypothetical protein